MDKEENKTGVLTAILGVYEEIGYVQKTGKMESAQQNYSYASESDFIATLRPAMINHKLVSRPLSHKIVHHEMIEVGKFKTPTIKTFVESTYRISHAPTGEYVDAASLSEGLDVGDKGLFKAMTGSQKYALRQTFLIETGNDPDDTNSDDLKASKAVKNGTGRMADDPNVQAEYKSQGIDTDKQSDDLIEMIKAQESEPELKVWRDSNRDKFNKLPTEQKKRVSVAYDEHLGYLMAKAPR